MAKATISSFITLLEVWCDPGPQDHPSLCRMTPAPTQLHGQYLPTSVRTVPVSACGRHLQHLTCLMCHYNHSRSLIFLGPRLASAPFLWVCHRFTPRENFKVPISGLNYSHLIAGYRGIAYIETCKHTSRENLGVDHDSRYVISCATTIHR